MTFEFTDKKKSKLLRNVAIVIVVGLTILVVGTHSRATSCSHAALKSFLLEIQQRGGSLVHCKEGECEDVRTGAYFGRKPDGFYLVYPDGTVTVQELREQRSILQRLMQDEESQCGVN